MTLRVARQWPVLRGAPATIGTLCRFQQLRPYAQKTKAVEKGLQQLVPLNSAIIIPASVNQAPAALIPYIKSITHYRAAEESFCVFLVTPSFAPWLLKDDVFLEKALQQTYGTLWNRPGRRTPGVKISALCAVVDKLPAGRPFKAGATLDDQVSRRSTELPVAGTGYEGIAYATFPATASVMAKAVSSSDHGAIDFIVGEHNTADHKVRDTVRLPLANTIFQTGTPTTMTFSSWKTRGKVQPLELVSKTKISRHAIRIARSEPSIDHVKSALSIPLLPLTVPRLVEGCMGNIIRRVIGSEGKSVTASSELEDVVPRFFKSRGEPAQATTAWALVIPKGMTETISAKTTALLWERLWRSDPPMWNTLVSKALAGGARLHRVLSGGGGWGKKAGLLSLDPVPASEDVDPTLLNDPEDFASTLTPVVRDGDSIQFFISPTSYLTAEAGGFDNEEAIKTMQKKDASGWELGIIPSTMDSIPGASWQHASPDTKSVFVFRNSFGALAEGGLTLARHSKARRPSAKEEKGFRTLNSTTVDVPFSRFWAVEVNDKHGSNKDPIYISNESNALTSTVTQVQSSSDKRNMCGMGLLPPLLNLHLPWPELPGKTAPKSARTLSTDHSFESLKAKTRLRRMSRLFNGLLNEYQLIMLAICQRESPLSSKSNQIPGETQPGDASQPLPKENDGIPVPRFASEDRLSSRLAMILAGLTGIQISWLTDKARNILDTVDGRHNRDQRGNRDSRRKRRLRQSKDHRQHRGRRRVTFKIVSTAKLKQSKKRVRLSIRKYPTIAPEPPEGTSRTLIRKHAVTSTKRKRRRGVVVRKHDSLSPVDRTHIRKTRLTSTKRKQRRGVVVRKHDSLPPVDLLIRKTRHPDDTLGPLKPRRRASPLGRPRLMKFNKARSNVRPVARRKERKDEFVATVGSWLDG